MRCQAEGVTVWGGRGGMLKVLGWLWLMGMGIKDDSILQDIKMETLIKGRGEERSRTEDKGHNTVMSLSDK